MSAVCWEDVLMNSLRAAVTTFAACKYRHCNRYYCDIAVGSQAYRVIHCVDADNATSGSCFSCSLPSSLLPHSFLPSIPPSLPPCLSPPPNSPPPSLPLFPPCCPQNCLIQIQKDGSMKCVVADFGLAAKIKESR